LFTAIEERRRGDRPTRHSFGDPLLVVPATAVDDAA
jgi:hypothetical protein